MHHVRRALLSVSDKTGIVELARALAGRGVDILSTGGTARLLAEHDVAVTEVSAYTGFPEIMGGRVKTLHPRIHGGLLARRDVDAAVMGEHGIEPIDLLAVNLYPFERTVAGDCGVQAAIENIDVGGPAMLRAAAKNHAWVCVVVDPGDYGRVLEEMGREGGGIGDRLRRELAAKAFAHTARYDGAIAGYLSGLREDGGRERFPGTLTLQLERRETMRYGENPHQAAAFYVEPEARSPSLARARLVQGKALSFNNVADADAALECVQAFAEAPACVIVKHANPCGAALGASAREAYEQAFRTDPTSAFGGIIALNRALDAELAALILERQFVEVIVVPEADEAARAVLAAKPAVRVLESGSLPQGCEPALDFRRVSCGLLVQDKDLGQVQAEALRCVTRRRPSEAELADLLFAWRVVKYVKSNGIVYARARATLGIGAGQMSRVMSARIAAIKAAEEGLALAGAAMASDAFFPFRDAIDSAAEAGIASVVQPGGSVRDGEVIAAADEHGMAMVLTGMRHFRH